MTAYTLTLWIYIVLLVVGGLIGFLKAGSKASLIASVAFATPLALCAAGVLTVRYLPEVLVGFLLVFFGRGFAAKRKFMPGGLMTVASIVALIVMLTQSH